MKSSYEQISVGPITIQPLIEPSDSNGAVAIHEFAVPAGTGLPSPITTRPTGKPSTGSGACSRSRSMASLMTSQPDRRSFVPRGATHSFACDDVDAAALAIITPGLLSADYFRELGAVVVVDDRGAQFAAISDVMQRHGLMPVA